MGPGREERSKKQEKPEARKPRPLHLLPLLPMSCLCVLGCSVGWLVIAALVALVSLEIWKRFVRKPTNLADYGAHKGAWAVITGASDGIGKAFAMELASRGFNTLLISRTESKLAAVQKEIEEKTGVETKILAVDFTSTDGTLYPTIEEAVKQCPPVGILVNNVGINYDYPEFFHQTDRDWNDSIINVNVKSPNEMSTLVLKGMLESPHKGGIINLGSFSGMIPTPMLAVYSATKAYLNFFSQCLHTEYQSQGVDVLCVSPAFVVSNMSKISRPSMMVASPETIAKGSVNVLGQERHWSPFFMHAVQERLLKTLPASIALPQVLKANKTTKTKALRRRERDANQKK